VIRWRRPMAAGETEYTGSHLPSVTSIFVAPAAGGNPVGGRDAASNPGKAGLHDQRGSGSLPACPGMWDARAARPGGLPQGPPRPLSEQARRWALAPAGCFSESNATTV
jgi:hypothetical protein